jgi:hypothetical protein
VTGLLKSHAELLNGQLEEPDEIGDLLKITPNCPDLLKITNFELKLKDVSSSNLMDHVLNANDFVYLAKA